MFHVNDGEILLKASQCYLYTTAGPIAGILFISTHKIAFCSERPISVPFPSGGILRTPYKVSYITFIILIESVFVQFHVI